MERDGPKLTIEQRFSISVQYKYICYMKTAQHKQDKKKKQQQRFLFHLLCSKSNERNVVIHFNTVFLSLLVAACVALVRSFFCVSSTHVP